MESHNAAVVCRLGNFQKIEGADRIIKASVLLNGIELAPIVTGVESVEDSLVFYFDSNMVISDKVLADYPDLATYLSKGRVRVVKLKNTISNGLAVPVDKFFKYSKKGHTFKEGDSFTTIDGTEICHKYVAPVKHVPQSNKKKTKKEKEGTKIVSGFFPLHVDTAQLARNIHMINPDDVIQISRKTHGTSSRVANTLIYRKLSQLEKVAKFLGVKVNLTEYKYAYGSRTVTKEVDGLAGKDPKHFYGSDIWSEAGHNYFFGKLHEGESVYFEIIGYMPAGAPIQKSGKFHYNYGNDPGKYSIEVYRITMTSPEGIITELSCPAYRARCKELGVNPVKEFFYGKANDLYDFTGEDWHKRFLVQLTIDFLEKDATDCIIKGTPDEGIVIRKEGLSIEVYKHKSQRFFLTESSAHEAGDVDTEEEA